VLVPAFNHPNDEKAQAILAEFFPDRAVVGIDCTDHDLRRRYSALYFSTTTLHLKGIFRLSCGVSMTTKEEAIWTTEDSENLYRVKLWEKTISPLTMKAT
jgi:hypothetical protein